MDMLLRNLKSYFKFLSKNKLYTFVSIFGFSVSLMFVIFLSLYAKQELSVDTFHEKKDRIYLMTRDHRAGFALSVAPYVQERCPEVEAFCRVVSRNVTVGYKDNEKFRSECMFADSTFFNVFSFKLLEGNPNQVLNAKSIVLTQSFAYKIFGNEDPLGKILSIDDTEHTVTGIMEDIPQNTHFKQVDFLVAIPSITKYWGDRIFTVHNNFGFSIYLLEKEGANLTAKVPFLFEEFKKDLWLYRDGFEDKFELMPLPSVYFDSKIGGHLDFKRNSENLIKIYIAIAILILIIATLNYVNMTVAQSGFRGKEAAIKKLLGSSKRKIIIQLLSESLFMALLTFGLGLLLAFLFEPFFDEVVSTKIELAKQFTAFNILVAALFLLLIAFVSGVIPALVISGFNPLEVVKGTFARKVKTFYSKGLIVFQYVVAISLLICSFFIKQQSDYLVNYDLGYNRDQIYTIRIGGLDNTIVEGLKNHILSISGVEKVSLSSGTPMDGGNNNSYEKDGETYSTQEILVDEDFLDLYGITTDPADALLSEQSVFVSKALFDSPLTNQKDMTLQFYEAQENIAGVLSDFNLSSLHDEQRSLLRIRKRPDGWNPWSISIKISSSADMFAVADKIQKEYTAYTGGEVPDHPEFIDSTIQDWYKKEENQSKIISAFTLLTIIISIMGVFAMSLYMIKQKEKEIGVRKVNGATESQVLLMLNKDSLLRVLIAFVIACPIAYYAITKWLEDFSYRISLNWWTFALAGAIIALLTLASVSYMTWKAARANPVETLKSE